MDIIFLICRKKYLTEKVNKVNDQKIDMREKSNP